MTDEKITHITIDEIRAKIARGDARMTAAVIDMMTDEEIEEIEAAMRDAPTAVLSTAPVSAEPQPDDLPYICDACTTGHYTGLTKCECSPPDLAAKNARLREALAPFAAEADNYEGSSGVFTAAVPIDWLRAARAAQKGGAA